MDELGKRPGELPRGRFLLPASQSAMRDTHAMNAIKPSGDLEDADAKIEAAMLAMDIVIRTFRDKMDEVAALETTTKDADVAKAIGRFRDVFTTLVGERFKLHGKVDGKFGGLIAEPIDLDVARVEIGRLLDRIRSASDPGAVPE